MSKFLVFLSCIALLLVAGCATTNEAPAGPEETVTNAVPVVTNLVVVPVVPVVPKTNPVVAIVTNVVVAPRTNPAPAKIVKPPPINAYTSLPRWAAEQRLSPPLLLSKSPVVTYSVGSKRGVLVFAIGSREATWNGFTFHLGFPPETIDGQIFVHGMDLRKNFEPLLTDPPLDLTPTNRVIVIDPGHGGMNAGTVSLYDKRTEKEFTLDWARRLVPLLVSNGWTVYLTRTNDVDLSLSNRVAYADARRADLFLSLHFNSAAPDKKENGVETYCLTPVGMPSTLTRGNPDPWTQWYANNNYDAANLQLAMKVHGAILRATGQDDRGVRRARFMGVLHNNHQPAILIEGGFLSNKAEADKIESPAFRQKLAEAVANALK